MIRLDGLLVHAGDFSLAIDDLAIGRAEYVMVLGPTASGKTLLLETVAGLRRPQSGHVWFGDREVTEEPPERRGAGLVYQDYALFPHLNVADNIGFGLRTLRSRKEPGASPCFAAGAGAVKHARTGGRGRVDELAALLHIEGLLERYPEGLSGGEQQRVALARALAIEPDVLLLDEPLSALDGPTRAELQAELKRLHQGLGATVVHVTHDLDEALVLGDRIAVLIDGELRQVGTPLEVTRFPADVGVARLIGLTNVFEVEAFDHQAGVSGGGPVCVRTPHGLCIFARPSPPAASPAALVAVIPADEVELSTLACEPADGSSDRGEGGGTDRDNLLDGRVRDVRVQSVHASVEVEVPIPHGEADRVVVTAHVLRPQVERQGLAAGANVRLRIPWTAVHLCSGSG